MDEIFGTSLTRDQDEEGQQQQEEDMDNMAHAPENVRDTAQPHDAHDRTGLDLNRSLDVNRVSDLRRSKRHHEGEARVNNGRQDLLEGLEDTQEDIGTEEGGEQQVDHPMVLLDNETSLNDSQQAAQVNSFTQPAAVDGDGGTTAGGVDAPGIRESEPPPGAAGTGPGDGDREESYGETDEGRNNQGGGERAEEGEESFSGGLPGLLSSPGADAEEDEGAGAGVERVETSDREELARENITVVGG
jgi:hypothetical protein